MDIPTKPIDDYINMKKLEGKDITYRDIVIAAGIRTFAVRPKINRFVTNSRIYQRTNIDVSMIVHKSLRTGDTETVAKVRFTGYETCEQIQSMFHAEIEKVVKDGSGTNKFTNFFTRLPHFMMKFIVRSLRFMDWCGICPDKHLFSSSPFHCSLFFSDTKSIKLDSLYHHLYNFGTCGFFATMGKEILVPVVDQVTGALRIEKQFNIKVSLDDRVVDGLYYSHVFKAFKRFMENPAVLDKPLEEDQIFKIKPKTPRYIKKAEKQKLKAEKKEQKQREKAGE
jgi:hypothetical protein